MNFKYKKIHFSGKGKDEVEQCTLFAYIWNVNINTSL